MAGKHMSGVQHQQRWLVVRPLHMHRTNDTQVVCMFAQRRENLADLQTRLAEPPELERRLEKIAGLALRLQIPTWCKRTVVLGEHRLGIEGIHLRWTAIQEKEDDVLRFRRKMRR